MSNASITNSTAMGAGGAQTAMTTTYKTLVLIGNSTTSTATLGSGSLHRGKLYDILIGTNGTPADNYLEFDVTRVTLGTSSVLAVGISSLSSNHMLDLADGGYINLCAINSSIETAFTATTETWYVGINQRASYRWVAAPGSEIVWPATTSAVGNNGIAVRARSGAYTGTATATVMWSEQ